MVRRTTYLKVFEDESQFISGAWAAHPKIKKGVSDQIIFGSEGSRESEQDHSFAVARYDFKEECLCEPKSMLVLEEGSSPPRKLAVQPKGDGVIVSFETGCKLYTWEEPSRAETRPSKDVELKLQPSEVVLRDLEGIGPQSCLLFSDDGTLLASGGKDGHVRVFQWPSMEVVMSVPKAVKGLQDLDISWDSGFLSAIGDSGPGRIWELSTAEVVATLEPTSGERFGFSRFSRNGKKAFLFVTVTKGNEGFLGVWDMTNWKRIGAKKFVAEPITAFAITHHGRRVAMGTKGGAIAIVEIDKMELEPGIESAHGQSVTSLEFSPNDKVLLSLSSDLSARVSALDLSKEWKAEWEVVEDDGFIYKRRKRKATPLSPATHVSRKEPVLSEEAQLRLRETLTRRKKMAMLLAQKEVYAAEVADWEIILKRQEESLACAPLSQSPPSPEQVTPHSTPHSTNEATSNEELQILNLQVEVYERFIQQLKSMRDQGESLCKKLEMDVETNRLHLEQDMFKEATKVTPRTILHNFTSPALPLPVAGLQAKSLLGQLLANGD